MSHKFILSVWDLAIIENALREYRDRWSNTLSRRGNRDLDALIANISAARPPIEKNEKDPHNGVAAPGNGGSARDERLPEAMLGNWCWIEGGNEQNWNQQIFARIPPEGTVATV